MHRYSICVLVTNHQQAFSVSKQRTNFFSLKPRIIFPQVNFRLGEWHKRSKKRMMTSTRHIVTSLLHIYVSKTGRQPLSGTEVAT